MSHQNDDSRTDTEIMNAFAMPMITHYQNCVYCNITYPTELGHICETRDNYRKWQREELTRRNEERRKFVESITPVVRNMGTWTTDPESGCTVRTDNVPHPEIAPEKDYSYGWWDREATKLKKEEGSQ